MAKACDDCGTRLLSDGTCPCATRKSLSLNRPQTFHSQRNSGRRSMTANKGLRTVSTHTNRM